MSILLLPNSLGYMQFTKLIWRDGQPYSDIYDDIYYSAAEDEAIPGESEFNPPSLRGVSQQNGFFHDNRAKELREVFGKYQHPGMTSSLTTEQIDDLVAFLESL